MGTFMGVFVIAAVYGALSTIDQYFFDGKM